MNEELKNFEQFASKVAKEAGALIMSVRDNIKPSEWKLQTNFKTEADDLSDKFIREAIAEKYPDHGILSEENKDKIGSSEYVWVIDPLDGTIPFTSKISNHFGVAISLVKNNEPLVGVFFAPAFGEDKKGVLYSAIKGQGAFANGKQIRCSDIDNLNHATLAFDYGKLDRSKINLLIEKLLVDDGVTYLTAYGGCSASMAQVAEGNLYGYFALKNEPWDMAATSIICKEAGCKVTNINGEEWTMLDESIVAISPNISNQFFEKIA
jgi:myo-inositol-1(or 4)-monophosphatase